jgi:RHS repeat-associated protein
MKRNSKSLKSLKYILLPVMMLFTFQSAFAGNYRNQQSVNRGQQQSLTINNLSLTINTNPFKYTGYYSDSESGLYYLKARYYSSELMRFINRDTYDLSNRYAYCSGDPISNADPTGHMPKWLNFGLAGVAILGGLFTGGAGYFVGSGLAMWLGIGGGTLGVASGVTQIVAMKTKNKKTSRILNSISFGTSIGGVIADIAGGVTAICHAAETRAIAAETRVIAAEARTAAAETRTAAAEAEARTAAAETRAANSERLRYSRGCRELTIENRRLTLAREDLTARFDTYRARVAADQDEGVRSAAHWAEGEEELRFGSGLAREMAPGGEDMLCVEEPDTATFSLRERLLAAK